MSTGHMLIVTAAISAVAGFYCMIRIILYLRSRGEKVNWFLLRFRWFSYMSKYRELTTEEYGESGIFLKSYIIFMLAALALVVAGAMMLGEML